MNQAFRVLVADDTQANRTLMRAYLGRLGFETVMAENGQEAVNIVEAGSIDLVLMDLMMPIMDGFEAIQRIRAMHSDRWIPIFVVSAMDAEADVVRGLEAGADDFLTKPVAYQVFAAKMRNMARALNLQRSREESVRRETAISNAVIDGIVTFDISGAVLSLNRAAQLIFDVEKNALDGRHFASFIAETERPSFALELARCLEKGEGSLIGKVAEIGAITPAGRHFPMELSISELPAAERRLFIAVIRDITERKRVAQQLADDASRLRQYHDEAESEADLAKEIMERHIRREGVDMRGAHQCVVPTTRFSGDIVLAARAPNGRLYAMLADATGHGLAAAMSGMSVVDYFYQAVMSNTPLSRMVEEMNNSLCQLLTAGRFVSAALACIDDTEHSGEMWLGGVPDMLQISSDGEIIQRFSASHLPLGVTTLEADEYATERFDWKSPGHILMYSDGALEATDPAGIEFGAEGIAAALRARGTQPPLDALTQALTAHLKGLSAHDDVSFLLLDLP